MILLPFLNFGIELSAAFLTIFINSILNVSIPIFFDSETNLSISWLMHSLNLSQSAASYTMALPECCQRACHLLSSWSIGRVDNSIDFGKSQPLTRLGWYSFWSMDTMLAMQWPGRLLMSWLYHWYFGNYLDSLWGCIQMPLHHPEFFRILCRFYLGYY